MDDELLERVRSAARDSGRSANRYIVDVLSAATDPGLAGAEVERVREWLRAAGLLAPVQPRPGRPDRQAVKASRPRAGQGSSLTELVAEGRR